MSVPMENMWISYRTLYEGAGAVYIFRITAVGMVACYRRLLYAQGTQTNIYAHKFYTQPRTGRKYIIIEHAQDGRHKIYLDDVKRIKLMRMDISDAVEDTGIKESTLVALCQRLMLPMRLMRRKQKAPKRNVPKSRKHRSAQRR